MYIHKLDKQHKESIHSRIVIPPKPQDRIALEGIKVDRAAATSKTRGKIIS